MVSRPAFSFVGSNLLSVPLNLSAPSNNPLAVVVTNPNPGSASVSGSILENFPTFTSITPTLLLGGMNTVTLQGTGFSDYSTFTVDGKSIPLTKVNTNTYTGRLFVAPWRNGSIAFTVNSIAGAPVSSSQTIPIETTTIPFDVAARFSTQAAFGPRIDIVQHIQHIGLKAFLTEQLQTAAGCLHRARMVLRTFAIHACSCVRQLTAATSCGHRTGKLHRQHG